MDANELINKWFYETFKHIEERLKTCEDIDMVLVSSLETGENYLRATLLLLQNNHIAPSKALLRIITEFTAKLLWCVNIPDRETGQVNCDIQERIDRWKKFTARKLADGLEKFSYAVEMDKKKISEEVKRLRSIAAGISYSEMPSTNQIFQDILDWYEKVYPQTYWQFNIAIHPDLKLLEILIEKRGNIVVCQNEDLSEQTNLLKLCVCYSYFLNIIVRHHYNWPTDKIEREYDVCMSQLEN